MCVYGAWHCPWLQTSLGVLETFSREPGAAALPSCSRSEFPLVPQSTKRVSPLDVGTAALIASHLFSTAIIICLARSF